MTTRPLVLAQSNLTEVSATSQVIQDVNMETTTSVQEHGGLDSAAASSQEAQVIEGNTEPVSPGKAYVSTLQGLLNALNIFLLLKKAWEKHCRSLYIL